MASALWYHAVAAKVDTYRTCGRSIPTPSSPAAWPKKGETRIRPLRFMPRSDSKVPRESGPAHAAIAFAQHVLRRAQGRRARVLDEIAYGIDVLVHAPELLALGLADWLAEPGPTGSIITRSVASRMLYSLSTSCAGGGGDRRCHRRPRASYRAHPCAAEIDAEPGPPLKAKVMGRRAGSFTPLSV